MRVFHRTSTTAAATILREGFRDGEGSYMAGEGSYRGVWVSAEPLDENEGANGDIVLILDIPAALFAEYEWVEEQKPYREALIPSALLNRFGPPSSS